MAPPGLGHQGGSYGLGSWSRSGAGALERATQGGPGLATWWRLVASDGSEAHSPGRGACGQWAASQRRPGRLRRPLAAGAADTRADAFPATW